MRLAFLGTPQAAVASLEALVIAGHDVAIVITRPDRRRGRGPELTPSPVKAAAQARGLRVAHELSVLDEVQVEWGVVAAYGAMIPAAVLERTPMLNVHFSLLPRWRGAAPVERAILAGDIETGVGIISLETTLDTGPLHAQRSTVIEQKTSGELTRELAQMGSELLVEVLSDPQLLANPRPQEGVSTYAEKLTTESFHLHPRLSRSEAARVVRLERAFVIVGGRRLRILRARNSDLRADPGTLGRDGDTILLGLSDAAMQLTLVQSEGSRAMDATQWWVGARLGEDVAWE